MARLCRIAAARAGPVRGGDARASHGVRARPDGGRGRRSEVLDACLYLYAAEKLATDEVSRALPSLFPDQDPQQLAAWAERFAELFVRSIYKWVQSPLAIHVGALDLDRERALQLPVVQTTEWGGT